MLKQVRAGVHVRHTLEPFGTRSQRCSDDILASTEEESVRKRLIAIEHAVHQPVSNAPQHRVVQPLAPGDSCPLPVCRLHRLVEHLLQRCFRPPHAPPPPTRSHGRLRRLLSACSFSPRCAEPDHLVVQSPAALPPNAPCHWRRCLQLLRLANLFLRHSWPLSSRPRPLRLASRLLPL